MIIEPKVNAAAVPRNTGYCFESRERSAASIASIRTPSLRFFNRLVFAPTKDLDGIHLEEQRIEFCRLPFEIYKTVKPKK